MVDKAPGLTSHQVVARVRRLLGTRKVGHAGTLDPMATGVLLVGVNRATRLLGHLMLTDKTYTATIRLGVTTVTDDAEGEVTGTPGAPSVSAPELADALQAFRGDIEQVPTAVSAIKVAGVRAYAKVRAGEHVELAARPVTVRSFHVEARRDLVADGTPVVDLDVLVECTTGTYIRALARDLGAALGTGGHLTALRRTRVGPFGLDEAQPLDEAEPLRLHTMTEVAHRSFATFALTSGQAGNVRFGRRLPDVELGADRAAVLSPEGEFLALYTQVGADAVPEAVFTS